MGQGHQGRRGADLGAAQSSRAASNPLALGHTPVAPSALPLNFPGAATPRELTPAEIEDIIERFATAAAVCETAGFDGVQIHGAHGYLVAQFLSPLSNQRDDEWGGDPERRMRFVLEVVRRIRARVSPGFAVGIKLNSADFQRGGFTEDESRSVVGALAGEGIDLIEVSGGSYEQPAMMGKAADSTRAREAYFLEYARTVRSLAGDIPLAVTGGFRSRAAMHEAVHAGECDVIGLGRPTATTTDAADVILAGRAETSPHTNCAQECAASWAGSSISSHSTGFSNSPGTRTNCTARARVSHPTSIADALRPRSRCCDATAPRRSGASVVFEVKRYSLSDKVVLITGAGRGLGAATATALTQRGARVVIADIDLLTARSVVAALPTGLGLALQCDVTDLASVQESVRLTLERFGRIDVVIANAGVLGRGGTVRTLHPDQVAGVLSVNVDGVVNTVSATMESVIGSRGQIVVPYVGVRLYQRGGCHPVCDEQGLRRAARPGPWCRVGGSWSLGYDGVLLTHRDRHDPSGRGRGSSRTRSTFSDAQIHTQAHSAADCSRRDRRRAGTQAGFGSVPGRWRPVAALRGVAGPMVDARLAAQCHGAASPRPTRKPLVIVTVLMPSTVVA